MNAAFVFVERDECVDVGLRADGTWLRGGGEAY